MEKNIVSILEEGRDWRRGRPSPRIGMAVTRKQDMGGAEGLWMCLRFSRQGGGTCTFLMYPLCIQTDIVSKTLKA